MMWNSKAIVFDLDDTLFLEANYFERIFSNFCLIYEWPKHAYESIINNFSIVRREHKDIFSYFLNQNQFYWQTGNANSDLNFFRILRDNLFSLYIEIDTKLIPIYGVKEWLNYAESNAIKVGALYLDTQGFFGEIKVGIESAGAEEGIELTGANSEGDVAKESEFIDILIAKGVDVVVMSPVSTEASVAAVERLSEAGIPVVCYNT